MRRLMGLFCALLFFCALPAGASPGGTDGNGGHVDAATGEYHFHHGFAAHQHINGVCPLDLNFTSNVVTGPAEKKRNTGSEDKDDVVVSNISNPSDGTYSGIERRGQAAVIASGVILALLAVGGFLSTVKKNEHTRGSSAQRKRP